MFLSQHNRRHYKACWANKEILKRSLLSNCPSPSQMLLLLCTQGTFIFTSAHVSKPRSGSSQDLENSYSFAHECKRTVWLSSCTSWAFTTLISFQHPQRTLLYNNTGLEHINCSVEFWLPTPGWQSFLEAAVSSESNMTWK